MTEFLPTVPQQRDFSNPLLELREKKVAAWLESLSLHDAPDAIDQLLQAMAPLNLEPVTDKVRLRLLEHYHGAVTALHHDQLLLDRQIEDLPPAQQGEIRDRLAELLWQLALGYKIVVAHGSGQGRSPKRDAPLLLALYRAVELLGLILLHAYRNYAVIPPHTYRELHQLYDFAIRHDVATEPVSPGKKWTVETTLGTLYKRALLLAAADPFRLPRGEVDQLSRLLAQFADHCRLTRPPWVEATGRFLVRDDQDRSPIPCSKLNRSDAGSEAWVLDTTPLREAIQNHLATRTESDRTTRDLNLLRRILPELKAPPKRRSRRTPSDKQLRASVGLAATHHFLSSAGAARLQQATETAAYGIEVFDAESESQISHLLEPWKVVNESPRGYLLTRRHTLDESLQVGEVLGLFPMHSADARQAAELAVIRWIKRSADNWTHMGVEVLPGRPDAVRCEPVDPGEDPFEEPRALFLNKLPNLPIPPTLLGRGGLYRKESDVVLEREKARGRARLGSLIMETAHLVRITLKPAR